MSDDKKNSHRALWIIGTAAVAIVTVLSLLGILPWVPKSEFRVFQSQIDKRLERIDDRVDDIHRWLVGGREQ